MPGIIYSLNNALKKWCILEKVSEYPHYSSSNKPGKPASWQADQQRAWRAGEQRAERCLSPRSLVIVFYSSTTGGTVVLHSTLCSRLSV